MPEMDHFTYGMLTPLAGYVASFIGCLTGLSATSRARATSTAAAKSVWLLIGAVSIGGTGVWVMHFIAMLGFTVHDMPIHYDVPLTIASALLSMLVVTIGLFLVGFLGDRAIFLLAGGVVVGLGVASMHYLGMAAMVMSGEIHYDTLLVATSLVIAVVAGTAALWLCVHVKGWLLATVAALVMAAAVSGMHYTGMAAMHMTGPMTDAPGGTTALELLGPLIAGVFLVTIGLIFVVLMWPTEDEMRERQEIADRLSVPHV
ncbi:MHYT domain-containing protein [Isoptericola croceus]|uniref:MHYT domain-containing protein n=1 Tax=Isoptericola croceus TaxID=3031406 RepID=UPI0023F95241|nr:MHYT domain-containing protein [Isoptericola croceus]